MTTNTWLSLTEAAQQLDVHPTTLRRWADNGDIPVRRTPGGHRRFAAVDIAYRSDRENGRIGPNLSEQWAEQALAYAREQLNNQTGGWLVIDNHKLRRQHRQLGRQLISLMIHYMTATDDQSDLLQQAKQIGQTYGQIAQESGICLTDAFKAVIFFRDILLETAFNMPDDVHIQPEANLQLMQRINHLLNTVHLAIAASYDS